MMSGAASVSLHQTGAAPAFRGNAAMSVILESTVHLSVPLARVWRLIVDLDGYKSWHPFAALAGEPVVGQPITLNYRSRKTGRIITSADAETVRVERHRAFAWRIGIGPILRFEEAFELSKAEHGTLLLHRIRMTGAMVAVGQFFFRRRLKRALEVTDRSLAAFLSKRTVASRYGPRPSR